MKQVVLKLKREEALACAIALVKEKPYGWQQDALAKVDRALGFKKLKTSVMRLE